MTMRESEIKAIIRQGEILRVEFKECNRIMAFTENHLPDKFYTENSNKSHGHGLIDPAHFSPFPKNPVIAKIFKEIGRADELGSGVRNLFKYSKVYSGMPPQLIEDDIFKIIVPLTPQDAPQAESDKINKILTFCSKPKTRGEIQKFLGFKDREHFRLEILKPLIGKGLLVPTIPDKPNSPKQKYYSVIKKEGLSL